jgi:DNA-directed RNA polymerase specialized sigma24 family protein
MGPLRARARDSEAGTGPLEEFVAAQVSAFRTRAEVLARYGAREAATSLSSAAEDLEGAFRRWWLEQLTIAEAAGEAGYSEERMRELIREGRLEGGRATDTGPLRVRRCDLPKKPGPGLSNPLRSVADRLGIR